MKTLALLLFFLTSAAAADDRPWWLLGSDGPLFPAVVRQMPMRIEGGAYRFDVKVGNGGPDLMKCDLAVSLTFTNGDDELTEHDYIADEMLQPGRTRTLLTKFWSDDNPEPYHMVLGSQRVDATCLGVGRDTDLATVPAPHTVCDPESGACTRSCQASDETATACADPVGRWGNGRFLVNGEGTAEGPRVAVDLYDNGFRTSAAVYVGPKAEARVCSGVVTVVGEHGTERHAIQERVLRAGRSAVLTWAGAAAKATGGSVVVTCKGVDGGGDAEEFHAEASLFGIVE